MYIYIYNLMQQVVNGPEILDKFVGEAERKVCVCVFARATCDRERERKDERERD